MNKSPKLMTAEGIAEFEARAAGEIWRRYKVSAAPDATLREILAACHRRTHALEIIVRDYPAHPAGRIAADYLAHGPDIDSLRDAAQLAPADGAALREIISLEALAAAAFKAWEAKAWEAKAGRDAREVLSSTDSETHEDARRLFWGYRSPRVSVRAFFRPFPAFFRALAKRLRNSFWHLTAGTVTSR